MAQCARHVIRYRGREFRNDYVFPAEIAALRAHKTGKFQEEVILEWVKKQNLKGCYVDAGAHIGNHTLFFAAFCPSNSVVAIEGHPVIYELLCGNIRRNLSKEEHLTVHPIGMAAWAMSDREVGFAPIPQNNAGHTHVINTGGRKGEKPSVTVKTLAIDDLELDKVTLMKIDVEDTEEQVIEGARKTIERHKPVIVIERHSKQQLQVTMKQLPGYKVVARWDGVHTFALRP